jgi:hypothetical protein
MRHGDAQPGNRSHPGSSLGKQKTKNKKQKTKNKNKKQKTKNKNKNKIFFSPIVSPIKKLKTMV